ncbi:sigma-70 family RNA polymerase sigma factor [Paenibacillaceae bacterium]|nr:sigma-70 family RNA polymerase sigma factor [Paenibacillaceae bacterium]
MEVQLKHTEQAIGEIIAEHADMVLRLCYVHLRNKADAEDAFQEVFMKLYEKSPTFHDKEHLKAWLITCTTNHCKNKLRSYWHRKRVDIGDVAIPERASDVNKEEHSLIPYVLALSLKYRLVIYLYYYEGYSLRDIAQMMKANEATIRTRLSRGREQLKLTIEHGRNQL